MPYDLHAYVSRDRLPSASALRATLDRSGRHLEIAETDFSTVRGFFPVTLDGTQTGFEIYPDPITARQRDTYQRLLARDGESSDQLLEILNACDLDIAFACRASDPNEVTAARIVATTIAGAALGWFRDPQTGEVIRYSPRP